MMFDIPTPDSYVRQDERIKRMGQYDVRPQFKDYTQEIRQRLQNANTGVAPNAVPGSIEAFLNALKSQESGDNYSSVNGSSGALGAYQIMPFNLGPWAHAAGYDYTPSRSQFLGDPQMQEAIARKQIQDAYNRYGDFGQVAAMWYGGEGGRKAYATGGGNNPESGGYPSIRAYVDQVLRRMQR